MRSGWMRRLGPVVAMPLAVAALGVAPALADEPPATTVADEPVATTVVDGVALGVAEALVVPVGVAVGVLDGVEVAVAEALTPPPPVATVAVPAERVATTVVDGVEVGVGEAPVPPAAPAVSAAARTAAAAPERVVVAQDATVALVLNAWG